MRYRRSNISGASYFFTVTLAERKRTLLIDHVDHLRDSIRKVKQNHPFDLDAMVVMPDHLHTIWTMPKNDADFSTRWALIKSAFSRNIDLGERISQSRQSKGERGIWQRRFWEHLIRDETDFKNHVDYIHYNPVKHGFVTSPAEWRWSSIHKFIRQGIVSPSWTVGENFKGKFGE
jgi:putative transposase